MKRNSFRILTTLALSSSLLACATDDLAVLDEEEAIVRAGEADFSAATARNVGPNATLAEAAADPLLVPLVVELYNDPGFKGARRNIVVNEPIFANAALCERTIQFENVTSAVIVREGPDYAAYKAANGEPYAVLYDDPHFRGRRLVLGVGGYSNLVRHDFENITSSLRFTNDAVAIVSPDVPSVTPMRPLTAVIEAHDRRFDDLCDSMDPVLTLVRTSGDLGRDFGSRWNDDISYFEIIPTGSFNASGELTVFEHDEFKGHTDGWHFDERYIKLEEFDIDQTISSYRRSF